MQNVFYSASKVPKVHHCLNRFKTLQLSDTQGNLLTATPWKNKNKIRSHTSNIQWLRIYITVPKGKKGSIVGTYWTKARPKLCPKKPIICIYMFDVKAPFRSSTPFSFVDRNTLLSAGLVPHSLLPVFGRYLTTLAIRIILGPPRQSGFYLQSFTQ